MQVVWSSIIELVCTVTLLAIIVNSLVFAFGGYPGEDEGKLKQKGENTNPPYVSVEHPKGLVYSVQQITAKGAVFLRVCGAQKT